MAVARNVADTLAAGVEDIARHQGGATDRYLAPVGVDEAGNRLGDMLLARAGQAGKADAFAGGDREAHALDLAFDRQIVDRQRLAPPAFPPVSGTRRVCPVGTSRAASPTMAATTSFFGISLRGDSATTRPSRMTVTLWQTS